MDNARYREFYQCDLDIIRTSIPTDITDLVLDDVDIIRCVIDILELLDFGEFFIKINNRKLLDIILDICGVEKKNMQTRCSSIDKLDKKEWKYKSKKIKCVQIRFELCKCINCIKIHYVSNQYQKLHSYSLVKGRYISALLV